MSAPLRLDWKGDADVPSGALLVATEVEWLRVASGLLAPDAGGVIVRGAHLCEWASQWWLTAGGACEEVHSTIDTLRVLSPDLSREEAQAVVVELGQSWRDKAGSTWKLSEVLAALFPSFGDGGFAWNRNHTDANRLESAADWLLWLEEQDAIPARHAKILDHQAEIWREGGQDSRDLFPSAPLEAKRALEAWLGLIDAKSRGSFAARESFPLPIPTAWQEQARLFYAAALTAQTQSDERALLVWWHRFESTNAPFALREIAAGTLVEVTKRHPRFLTGELVARLEPFVGAPVLSELRRLRPPAAPAAFPQGSAAAGIFNWVTQQYLPFRAWQCENEDAAALPVALQAAREFGAWFLPFYALAISGAGRESLQIHRAGTLRTDSAQEVTFWVIADGLGWLDAQTLVRLITERSARFSLSEATPFFATLPTITSFAKPSLRWSAPPSQVQVGAASTRRELDVAGHKQAAEALQDAQAGDLVTWTPLEPDKTYHENADAGILRGRVSGVLAGLAQNIVEAALSARSDVPLRIVVTTDHGRLLGSSRRSHAIPPGFTGHGRAAYGDSKPDLGATEGVVWLDPDVYGCKSHVAIATDEGAFLTNASEGARGRTGVEKFPHGGVFPEEVVVPWLCFERDAAPIQIEAVLVGKSRAERAAAATLRLINSSNRVLTLERIELSLGRQAGTPATFTMGEVPSFATTEIEVQLASWPDAGQAKEMTALLSLRAPDGRLVSSAAAVRLEVEALQTRENILDDLF